ncbi:MAG TPA: hypothetical protein VFU46_05760 [Gemmatimonadales bacterium]|nr:hypothetical protein [Gemmatimonadales bacterium]
MADPAFPTGGQALLGQVAAAADAAGTSSEMNIAAAEHALLGR